MACARAPPSDQDSNSYVTPPAVWTAGASIRRLRPATPVTESGAGRGSPSNEICTPATSASSRIVARRGWTSRNTLRVRPAGSVTVRWTRYQTFGEVSPVVGITNVPDFEPVVGGT